MKLVNHSRELVLHLRGWLATRKYDIERLRRPAMTEAKRELADAAQPAAVRLALSLRSGDWGFVMEILPVAHTLHDSVGFSHALELKGLMRDLHTLLSRKTSARTIVVSLAELQALFAALIDPRIAQMAPAKFRQYLMHNELPEVNKMTPRRRIDRNVRGVSFALPTQPERRRELLASIEGQGYGPDDNDKPMAAVE